MAATLDWHISVGRWRHLLSGQCLHSVLIVLACLCVHPTPSGQRRRDALQVGDLLLHGGAGEAGAGVAGGEAEGMEGRHRHRGPAGAAVLPRRGLPPAVPGEGRPVRKEGVQRPHPMLRVRGHLTTPVLH